jgi:hypothetical protein
MKNWAALTIVLYLVAVSVLCMPIMLVAYPEEHQHLKVFYFYFVPFLVLCQGVLLLVPAAVARDRPVRRRSVATAAIVGAIPMVIMILGFLGCVISMIWPENSPSRAKINYPDWINWAVILALWAVWGAVFYRSFAPEKPADFTTKMTRWLLAGSILEVVVAIPSHIISRHRNECCAPIMSLLGIVTGVAVALMAFGPGVFLLFARRIRDKQAGGN